jgi:LacI family transcriptional regulator
MKATITDVAKHAGVSMKTVSRVLNNEPNVAQKTREKVMEVAKELRYSPNLAAKGLASSKSYLLALIYDNPSAHYISNVQSGAIEACRQFGYHLVPEPIPRMEEGAIGQRAEAIRSLIHKLPVDGVILTPPLSDSENVIKTLQGLEIPYVLIAPSNVAPQTNTVKMNDVQAAREMTEHLIAQGHKSIGFVKGHVDHSATALRYQGFRDAMADAHLPVHDHEVKQGDFSFMSGVEAGEALLASNEERPTAIFASNDDMAAGVVSAASKLGIDVPNSLSVCGFDDTPLAKILSPQLTTVQQPIFEMGYQAACVLIDPEKKDADPASYHLDFKLIARDSTTEYNP